MAPKRVPGGVLLPGSGQRRPRRRLPPQTLPLGLVDGFAAVLERSWSVGSAVERRAVLAMSVGLCGLRGCEVTGLLVSDVLVGVDNLFVDSQKRGLPRHVPLGRSFVDNLLAMRAAFGPVSPSAWLFCARGGGRWEETSLRGACRSLCISFFGRPFGFRAFRHTAAVRKYLATGDVFAVQQLLGHSSLKATHRYLATLVAVGRAGLPDFVGPGSGVPRPATAATGGLRLFHPEGEVAGPVRALASAVLQCSLFRTRRGRPGAADRLAGASGVPCDHCRFRLAAAGQPCRFEESFRAMVAAGGGAAVRGPLLPGRSGG